MQQFCFLKIKQSSFHLFNITNLAVYHKNLALRILCTGIPGAIFKYFSYDVSLLGVKSVGENRQLWPGDVRKKSSCASLRGVLRLLVKHRIWGLCVVVVVFLKGTLDF